MLTLMNLHAAKSDFYLSHALFGPPCERGPTPRTRCHQTQWVRSLFVSCIARRTFGTILFDSNVDRCHFACTFALFLCFFGPPDLLIVSMLFETSSGAFKNNVCNLAQQTMLHAWPSGKRLSNRATSRRLPNRQCIADTPSCVCCDQTQWVRTSS